MSFAFNFSGDDIDVDNPDSEVPPETESVVPTEAQPSQQVPAVEHEIREWLKLLPSQLSYSSITVTSPTGKQLCLPRRELFDIRQQLMAEDADSTLHDLDTSDLRSNVYEGGFKTWECSVDLASLLLDRGPRKDIDELIRVANVVELGAGTGLPTLVLFQHAFRNQYPVAFTVADYNSDVLRLVTLPNLLLTYARFCARPHIESTGSGDLEITPKLVEGFLGALQSTGISIRLLSGAWGAELSKLMPASAPDLTTLVLAAETIYSPASMAAFVVLLQSILISGQMNKAMIAAKKFYFGVGGSIDALKVACEERGMVASEIENSGLSGLDDGVGRAVVEIQTF